MAVEKMLNKKTLSIVYQDNTDHDGPKNKMVTIKYSNINQEATDDKLLELSNSIFTVVRTTGESAVTKKTMEYSLSQSEE